MVHGVKQSKSVADARAVEDPALFVDEPSEQSMSVADARAVEGLCFFRLACFRFAAGKAASPVVHDMKQSKSVADARAVEGPALFVDEPSEQLKSVADARAVELYTPTPRIWPEPAASWRPVRCRGRPRQQV